MDDGKRYLVRTSLVLGATAAVLVGLVSWQIGEDGSRAADRTLSTLAKTQLLLESQENRNLTTRGELIAGNQAVVAYMTQALGSALPGTDIDRSSIVDLLEERRTQLGLDMAAVVDADGRVLGATDPAVDAHDFTRDPVFVDARKTQTTRTGLWSEAGSLLHVAMLPLARYGSGDAYLLVGQKIGDEFAQTIAGIGAADVAIIAPAPSGQTVVVSTLEPADGAALALALDGEILGDGSRRVLPLSGRNTVTQSAALFGHRDVRLLALAQDLSVGAIAATHLPTMLFAIGTLLALAAALAWYWRQVAKPLLDLERLMGRSADTGDRNLRMSERGAAVVARVAAAFNRLMGGRNGARD